MEKTGPLPKDKPPVLFCLDEFAALGRHAGA
jgi:type IV secretory pathway TraG/TraD family ATPase VirD4